MNSLKNKIAVITGAGSGIGRALAIGFTRKCCRVVLNEYHQDRLDETVEMIEKEGGRVLSAKAFDVTETDKLYALAKETEAKGGANIVVNNAGIAVGGFTAETTSIEDFERVMNINFWAVVHGTRAFLPQIKKQEEGCVANISSVFGLAGIAEQSAYCSSKFAVRGFTESLKMESMLNFPHVNIMCVHPGGIKTNIARDSKQNLEKYSKEEIALKTAEFEKALVTSPEDAADTIIQGILKKKQRVLIGKDARQFSLITRLFPTGYSKMIIKEMKKQNLT